MIPVPVSVVLFLPPYRVKEDVDKWYTKVHGHFRVWIGVKTPGGAKDAIKVVMAEPP